MALDRVGTAMMRKIKYQVMRGKRKTGVRPPEHGRALAVHAVQFLLLYKSLDLCTVVQFPKQTVV